MIFENFFRILYVDIPNTKFDSRNSAIVVDGVHIAHGVAEWQPNGQRRSPPNHSKDDDSNVVFDQASNKWVLYKNNEVEAT